MAEDHTLSPGLLAQIRRLWDSWRSELKNPDAGHRGQAPANECEWLQGFLNEDLAAAGDTVDEPTTAELQVWGRNPTSGELEDQQRTITVTNRDTAFSASEGDYLKVFWLEGEWRPLPVPGSGVAAVATLSEAMCADDVCVPVQDVIGASGVSTACNLLGRQGQAGDRVVIVPITGEGMEELCQEEDQPCVGGDTFWVVIAVAAKRLCVYTKGGERRDDCIVLPMLEIAAEYCSALRCGESVGTVIDEPVGDECDLVDLEFSPWVPQDCCVGCECPACRGRCEFMSAALTATISGACGSAQIPLAEVDPPTVGDRYWQSGEVAVGDFIVEIALWCIDTGTAPDPACRTFELGVSVSCVHDEQGHQDSGNNLGDGSGPGNNLLGIPEDPSCEDGEFSCEPLLLTYHGTTEIDAECCEPSSQFTVVISE
jgi:hypothetical protein